MAKESGLGLTVTVDDSSGNGQAISNDITDLQFAMPSGVQDITGVNKSAHERLHLLADFTVSLHGVFNDAASLSFQIFKAYRTLSGTEVGRTTAIAHSGQTLTQEVLYSDFGFNRATDGSLMWTAPGSMSNGTFAAWA